VTTGAALQELAGNLEGRLRGHASAERAVQAKAYLKSSLEFLGVSVPDTRSAVRAFLRSHPELSAADARRLVVTLWNVPVFERRAAAVFVLVAELPRSGPEDMELVERLLRDCATWALVDPLSCDVSGGLVQRFPELGTTLDRWAADDNFWLRRAALLSLLVPLRRGGGDWEHFVRLAEPMLGEREFFIRKALGWVLRETAKRRPELVADWLRPRAAQVSRLTLREAIKPLPAGIAAEMLALAGVRPAPASPPRRPASSRST
jgi:3-methyladenine DNA glycosylase AlkD